MEKESKTYVIYARVSTEEQAEKGRSIDDQVSKLTRVVAEKGGVLSEVFTDPGFSGSSKKRPGLQAMLAHCQANPVHTVLIVDTDRLARNSQLHFWIKEQLKKSGTAVESLNQPMINDSPEGNFLDAILAATNALYPQITGRKTSLSMAEKVRSGWWPGPARLGYMNKYDQEAPSPLDRRTIAAHPVTAPLVTEAFRLYATGHYTLDTLCDEMKLRGMKSLYGKPVGKTSMRKMLGDTFYIGQLRYKGEILPGKQPPLTDETTFQRVQLVLACHNRSADRSRKHQFLLSGYVYCGLCGSRYTASIQHRKKRSYYHCPNQKVKHTNFGQHMLVAEMDEMFSDLFKNMSLPREIIERTIAKAKEVFRRSHGDLDTKIRELSVHKTRLEDRRNELEVKLLDKVVTDDTYRRQSTDLNNQIRDIDTELAKLQSAKTGNMLEFEQLLKMADNIYAAFQEAPYELKRKYFGLFWEKLTVQDKKIKEAVPSKLFRAVLPLSFATLKTRKPIKENIPVQLVSSSQGWLPG